MSWRAGNGRSGESLVDAAPFAPIVRRAWKAHTLAELSAMTGVSPTVLHHVIRGDQPTIRVRTAVKLMTLKDIPALFPCDHCSRWFRSTYLRDQHALDDHEEVRPQTTR